MSAEGDPSFEALLRAAGAVIRGSGDAFAGLSDDAWAGLLGESDMHWLSPLIYRELAGRRSAIALPPAVWRGFKWSYRLSRARTRRADALIMPVLSAFNARSIPVIALKGLHLSTQVYADPATRPMIDADLLVRDADLAAAARIVRSFGFRQRKAEVRDAPDGEAARHHLATFWYPDGPPIEIHRGLAAAAALPAIDVDDLWRRASPARMGNADVLVLSREDALLHLCIHAGLHHEFAVKLLNLCDLPVCLQRWRDGFDWDAFWSRACAWGVAGAAQVALAFTRDRLACPLPEEAARRLGRRTPESRRLIRQAERRMRRKALALAERGLPRSRAGRRPEHATAGAAPGGGPVAALHDGTGRPLASDR